jgi:phosphosulfolactate synthase (CoM biosynthesis protein A)
MDIVIKAILKINPTAEVSVSGDDINTITWENGTTPISKADIQAKMVEVQADYDAKQYQRDRAAEYPSMADQLDDIYHNGIDAWKATIKTIKDKYPKE